MSITYIKRFTGALNSLVQINSSDSTVSCLATNYITAQAANIAAVNDAPASNPFQWLAGDVILLVASDGSSLCTIDAGFDTLSAIASSGVIVPVSVAAAITAHSGGGQASATQMSAVINNVSTVAAAGNSVKLPASAPGLQIVVINSGANPMQVFGLGSDTINSVAAATGVLQAVGAAVVYRCVAAGNWLASLAVSKGTGTVSANAVTINAQAGVITTGNLSTASGAAATAITLTNDFITSSSVVLCQVMGGTNTTNGIDLIAVPGNGSASITIFNNNVSGTALSGGTVIIGFYVL